LRILSRKIWRAFPELDQFDDETCKLYIQRIISRESMWMTIALLSTTVLLAFAGWFFGMQWVKAYSFGLTNAGASSFSNNMSIFFIMFSLTGHVWFPLIALYVVRDRWFASRFRKFVQGTSCGCCGYSLIGLPIVDDHKKPSVLCPECGQYTAIQERNITESDIDPTRLTKS
jgi:hypothetical protein